MRAGGGSRADVGIFVDSAAGKSDCSCGEAETVHHVCGRGTGGEAWEEGVVELRFKVADGFHVNSHTPKSELLIPTNLLYSPRLG